MEDGFAHFLSVVLKGLFLSSDGRQDVAARVVAWRGAGLWGCAGRAWAQTLRATWASFSRRNIARRASAESTPAAHAFRYLSSASSLSFDGGGGGGGIETVGSTRGWSTAVPSVRRAANRGAWLRTVKETLPARDAKSSSSMR